MSAYPEIAGAKEETTSREAAVDIEANGRAGRLRTRVTHWYQAGNTGTPDECAEALKESILTIRPRVSELSAAGVLVRTPVRRRNPGGRMAWVMRAK